MAAPSEPIDIPTSSEMDADSPITEDLMQKIRKTLTNLAEQLSDGFTPAVDHDHDNVNSASVVLAAGSVDQTAIGANAVGTSELKTATDTGSLAILASARDQSLTLTGGSQSWYTLGATAGVGEFIVIGNGDTAAGVLGFRNMGASTNTVYKDERYVTASPPYNLGDGVIGLFICVAVDSNGEIVAINVAPDPIWAYNGPTNIIGKRAKDGKIYQEQLILPQGLEVVPGDKLAQIERGVAISILRREAALAKTDILAAQAGIKLLRNAGEVVSPEDIAAASNQHWQKYFKQMEVTQAIKNADKDIIPHPWGGFGEDVTILYLDGVTDLNHGLLELHESGENIRNLIRDDYIRFDNVEMNRARPAGTMSVAMSMR